jgi:hypothetical protein
MNKTKKIEHSGHMAAAEAIAATAERKQSTARDHAIIRGRGLAFSAINRNRQLAFSTSSDRDIRMAVALNFNVHLSVLAAMERRPENQNDEEMMAQIAKAKGLCDYRQKRLLGLIRPDPEHKAKLGLEHSDHQDDLRHLHLEDHPNLRPQEMLINVEPSKERGISATQIVLEPEMIPITIRTAVPA